ncbi:DUF4177 domain-containing protein [Bacillus ndiopicus]|uniref:DUF4177 domain-containing protein n=1 Tax=Bacillus ndiopicus TaxID=1347368 RepID=UPI0005A68E44|nr:DUF4177 domain-containing protein [Bacillus ndiopicus]
MKRTYWEYKTFVWGSYSLASKTQDLEMELTNLGLQGWELVSNVITDYSGNDASKAVFIFKRLIE